MTNRLTTLNALRTAAGKAPLKSWKESNAKLEAAIAALTPAAKLPSLTPLEESVLRTFNTYSALESTLSDLGVSWNGVEEIADKIGSSQSIVKGVVSSLQKKHLIECNDDQPTQAQILTARGATLLHSIKEAEPAAKLSEPEPAVFKRKFTRTAAKKDAPTADRPLKAICKELNLNPKVARAKLRKAGLSAPYTDAKAIRKALA